ncbi:C-type lectin domain family 3 member A homolog [Gigantopelta aegis]|uniref:C-type lectin domain family 3 member A homolog n=1 Tax=Gigantopelta aegis TaxID=1735272 RepID=UPI001B88B5CF|nr:C-type lectin domain family 3 member A homolog [Gigantopelta aegis]
MDRARPEAEDPFGDGFVLLENSQLCFKVFEEVKTPYEARNTCNRLGAKLIVVDTEEKNTAVSEYVKSKLGSNTFLIGLTHKQNRFVWENGNEATVTHWDSGLPRGANRDCVVLYTHNALWYDFVCSFRFRYICEKQLCT